MPFTLPAVIGLISAGISGTELGMGLAGVGQPSPGDAKKQQEAAAQKQAQADADTKRKMILAALPGAQEQSGGALNEPSLLSLGSIIAGLPGEATSGAGKGALNQFLGLGSSPSANNENMVNATYGLSGSQG